MGSKIYVVPSDPTALGIYISFKTSYRGTIHRRSHKSTPTVRVLVLVAVIRNSHKVLFLRLFSQTNRAPEIQVIIRFFEILAPGSEKTRVRGHYDAVHPRREKEQKRETNVSREKGLENPERSRVKYVTEEAEGRNETSCHVRVSALMRALKKHVVVTARER